MIARTWASRAKQQGARSRALDEELAELKELVAKISALEKRLADLEKLVTTHADRK